MIIFKKAQQLTDYIQKQKKENQKIGFVPTMGALHEGHLSLIESCKKSNGISICSIFINPSQFNSPDDFKHYPITTEKDIEQLVWNKCDVLFLPAVNEIYPDVYTKKQYALGKIENILEGHYRPGHFQGVCQVMERLLSIVQPDNLFLGQKDFQQCIVIKKLISLLGKENEIILTIVPTMREKDGLAMSSRNLRLNEQQRQLASFIFVELSDIKNNFRKKSFHDLKSSAKEHLIQKGFQVDYVEIANADDLSIATDSSKETVALAAASIGSIRLIDNMPLN